jgi:hypothetical protein
MRLPDFTYILLHPPSGRVDGEALRAVGEGRCAREGEVESGEEKKKE